MTISPINQTGADKGYLLAGGDSWFSAYAWPTLLQALRALGYDPRHVARPGDRLKNIASQRQLDQWAEQLRRMILVKQAPKALLLCGGGMDVVEDRLLPLVNQKAPGERHLKDEAVAQVVDVDLRSSYVAILERMTKECEKHNEGRRIPIVLHGYDFPIPDGNGWAGTTFTSWLYQPLVERGYTDLAERKAIMAALITRLNDMQIGLTQEARFEHVRHVSLTGTLAVGEDYRAHWRDELHPTEEGFRLLAEKFATQLEEIVGEVGATSIFTEGTVAAGKDGRTHQLSVRAERGV